MSDVLFTQFSVSRSEALNAVIKNRELHFQVACEFVMSRFAVVDPTRFDVRGTLSVGENTTIDINAIFEGDVILGDDVYIGPNCVLKNCSINDGVRVEAFSHVDGATVADKCTIGPYARLRPGTVMESRSNVGNFCETKVAHLHSGVKVNHLSYIGNANIGAGTNVGAGTITCNYDGKKSIIPILERMHS